MTPKRPSKIACTSALVCLAITLCTSASADDNKPSVTTRSYANSSHTPSQSYATAGKSGGNQNYSGSNQYSPGQSYANSYTASPTYTGGAPYNGSSNARTSGNLTNSQKHVSLGKSNCTSLLSIMRSGSKRAKPAGSSSTSALTKGLSVRGPSMQTQMRGSAPGSTWRNLPSNSGTTSLKQNQSPQTNVSSGPSILSQIRKRRGGTP